MIVLTALALVAFIFVPGWLAVSLLRGEGSLNGHERLYLAAVMGMGIVAICALALALASLYSLPAMLVLVGAACIALLAAARGKVGWPLRLGRNELLLALCVITVALVLSSPPGRTVFGWSDVGLYPDIAAHIERNGSIRMEVPTAREVAPERRDLLYMANTNPRLPFEANENKAYVITDFETGRVTPIFYHFWPALMAVFASFLGLEHMFWAVTAAGVLALWGFLLLARRMLGKRWGLVAAALFALSPIYLYFSRYATTEMMNMALFVAASICLSAYLREDRSGEPAGAKEMAIAAAFLFTLGFFCRIDYLLVLGPLAMVFIWRRIDTGLTRADWLFCCFTLAGAVVATAAGLLFSGPYFHSILGQFTRPGEWIFSPYGAAFIIATFAFIFAKGLRGTAKRIRQAGRVWTVFLWLFLGATFVYLYFVRPGNADALIDYGVINPIEGSSYINQTLVRWAWYYSFTGVLLVFAGYGLWFSRRRSFPDTPVMMIGIFMTLIYGINMRCTPMHILTMRRLVPVILPAAALAIAYVLMSMVEAGKTLCREKPWTEAVARMAVGGLLLYLLLFSANASVPIFGLEEGGNQLEVSGEIADSVVEDAVVLMDYHLGDLYGPPLRSFYGVENAWLMDNSILGDEVLPELLGDLGFPERPVYLLWRPSMSGYHVPVSDRLVLGGTEAFLSWEESLEKSFEERPGRRVFDSEEVWLLRVVEEGGSSRDTGL